MIAQKYIIPKQLDLHGLTPSDLTITDAAIRKIIADYTREAGLRNLEREIAAICRKIGPPPRRGPAQADHDRAQATSPSCSGPSRFFRELADRTGIPGVATGLAWTPTGGEILFIEATGMPGKGVLDPDRPAGRVDARERPGRPELPAEPRQGARRSTPRGSARPTCTSTSRPAPSPRTAPRPAWRSPPR